MNSTRLAKAYLEYYLHHGEGDFRTWMQVEEIVRRDPDEGWLLVLALVDAARNHEELMYVAAGPLEEFLIRHGQRKLADLTAAAQGSRKLRRALAGVWGREDMSGEVRRVLELHQEISPG